MTIDDTAEPESDLSRHRRATSTGLPSSHLVTETLPTTGFTSPTAGPTC